MNFEQQIEEAKIRTNRLRNSEEYEFLNPKKVKDFERIGLLIKNAPYVIDEIDALLDELYEIRFPSDHEKNPSDIENFNKEIASDKLELWGVWVYYLWSGKLVHFPPEEIWEEIRTARNKPLITPDEQSKFWDFNIGIVGLSVGQSAALTIARCAGCKNMKLADLDTLDPTNLNRLDGNMSNCGSRKVTLIKQKILELDPYYNIDLYREGISTENIDDFFVNKFKIDAVIDAMDNIPLKIALRLTARKYQIPVLMATDTADGVLLDIERYDLEKDKAIFGGRVDEQVVIKNKMDFIKAGLKIISPEYITLPMAEAMMKVGDEVPTHPQLGSSAIMSGAVMTYVVRKLSLGLTFPSERTHIDLEQYFNKDVKSESYREKNIKVNFELKKFIGM